MKISSIANQITPSLTRELYNKAQEYDDVIDLTLGDPDIQPSEIIKNAAIESIKKGKTRYSVNAGLIELRTSIANQFEKEYGIHIDADENVIVTVGGMEALFLSLKCIIDEGDEVIIPAPYYVNYVQMVKMCGGIPIIVNTDEENSFAITAQLIEPYITDRTVAIIINSPSNPTGQILSVDILDEIARLANKYDLSVISDEVYKTLIYNGFKHNSIINSPNMKEKTIIIDSLSKRFAMTGYRIGYAIAPKEMIANMTKMQENVAACVSLPSQYAAIAAIENCLDDEIISNIFEERCKIMYDEIINIKKLKCRLPKATFYLFVNIKDTGLNSMEFAYRLLECEHVAVAPGITYGEKYDSYIRIACTLDKKILKKAGSKISHFVNEL